MSTTPGPWMFYTEPQPNGCPIVCAEGLTVCMLAHNVNYEEQKETALANARLITAAPNLLKEYQELLARLKRCSELCFKGHSQCAEELCHEMADFKSPAINFVSDNA